MQAINLYLYPKKRESKIIAITNHKIPHNNYNNYEGIQIIH